MSTGMIDIDHTVGSRLFSARIAIAIVLQHKSFSLITFENPLRACFESKDVMFW